MGFHSQRSGAGCTYTITNSNNEVNVKGKLRSGSALASAPLGGDSAIAELVYSCQTVNPEVHTDPNWETVGTGQQRVVGIGAYISPRFSSLDESSAQYSWSVKKLQYSEDGQTSWGAPPASATYSASLKKQSNDGLDPEVSNVNLTTTVNYGGYWKFFIEVEVTYRLSDGSGSVTTSNYSIVKLYVKPDVYFTATVYGAQQGSSSSDEPLTSNVSPAYSSSLASIQANASASGTRFSRRSYGVLRNNIEFTGTDCGVEWAAGLTPPGLGLIHNIKIKINGSIIYSKKVEAPLTHGEFDFDSTHFSAIYYGNQGEEIKYKPASLKIVVILDSTNGPKVITYKDFAYNYAAVFGSSARRWGTAAEELNALKIARMNHTVQRSNTANKDDILVAILFSTVFYVGTHGEPGLFYDCLETGSVHASEVTEVISQKKKYLKPSYNFVFIDGCQTANSHLFEEAFDVENWEDVGYLGWVEESPNSTRFQVWSEDFCDRLLAGSTLKEARDGTFEKFVNDPMFVEHQAFYAVPRVKGDPNMTLFKNIYKRRPEDKWFRIRQ